MGLRLLFFILENIMGLMGHWIWNFHRSQENNTWRQKEEAEEEEEADSEESSLFSTHLDSLWPPISSTSISFRLSLLHSALASSVFVSDQRLLFIFTPRIRWVRDRALRFVASLILNSSISVSVELFICSLSTIYCVCVKKRIILER